MDLILFPLILTGVHALLQLAEPSTMVKSSTVKFKPEFTFLDFSNLFIL